MNFLSHGVYILFRNSQALIYTNPKSQRNSGLFCKFQGGGSDVVSVSCFGVRFSVMFHFMFVHYTFSSV